MAPVTNSAESTYTLSGSSDSNTVTSNELSIDFINSNGLNMTKTASPTTYVNGSIIDYTLTITNTSGQFLNGVRIIDNLGGGNLAYVLSSGSLTAGGVTYPVTPVATNPLTFTLQELNPGQSMTLRYKGQVIFNLPPNVMSITNSVQGIGYTATGTVNGSASRTIVKKNDTELEIVKTADQSSVSENEGFTYFITLTNPNSVVANVSNITDQLPTNFTLNTVKLKIGTDLERTLDISDYTLSGSNELIVPSSSGPTITVPANGQTVLSLTGFLS